MWYSSCIAENRRELMVKTAQGIVGTKGRTEFGVHGEKLFKHECRGNILVFSYSTGNMTNKRSKMASCLETAYIYTQHVSQKYTIRPSHLQKAHITTREQSSVNITNCSRDLQFTKPIVENKHQKRCSMGPSNKQ